MKHGRLRTRVPSLLIAALALFAAVAGSLLGTCGPFTDVAADAFCPFVLEIFYLGITTGTSPTTYDPTANVTRLQMAAFLSRTVDGALRRGGRRAALDQFWTTQNSTVLGVTTIVSPVSVRSDGADIWVSSGAGTVSRVRESDGRLLETWTGATGARGVISAMGRIIVVGATIPGSLYVIDPTAPAGAVLTVATNLGNATVGVAFDGARFWTADNGSVSVVTPGPSVPWTVTVVSAGFNNMNGPVFDGNNIWAANRNNGTLLKLDSAGAILATVTVGGTPAYPVYDGSNLWVPTQSPDAMAIVRPASGAILATLTGNGLFSPGVAAFDGERILVTNAGSNTVALWKAADLTPLGSFDVGGFPNRACSDGIHFWVSLTTANRLVRF